MVAEGRETTFAIDPLSSISCGLQERDGDKLRVRDESAIETNFEIETETEIEIDLPIPRWRSKLSTLAFHNERIVDR